MLPLGGLKYIYIVYYIFWLSPQGQNYQEDQIDLGHIQDKNGRLRLIHMIAISHPEMLKLIPNGRIWHLTPHTRANAGQAARQRGYKCRLQNQNVYVWIKLTHLFVMEWVNELLWTSNSLSSSQIVPRHLVFRSHWVRPWSSNSAAHWNHVRSLESPDATCRGSDLIHLGYGLSIML